MSVCERAGSPAAEAVLPGSVHPADEAGAAPSRHDEGRTQQPERTTSLSARGPTCTQLVVTQTVYSVLFLKEVCVTRCRQNFAGSWRNVTNCGLNARWHAPTSFFTPRRALVLTLWL